MAKGMEMMLSALGINPEEIKAFIQGIEQNIVALKKENDAKLAAISGKIDQLIALVESRKMGQ